MNTPHRTKVRHPDRVTLNPESLARISKWVEELQQNIRGIRISKNDLVNFLINTRPPQLNEEECNSLKTQYFDEVRFYSWALARLKTEKAQGKSTSLAEIISSAQGINQ